MKIDQEKEEQARQEIEKREMENDFKLVWLNPGGEAYQSIWSSLSNIEQGFNKGSLILEQVMKAKYISFRYRKNTRDQDYHSKPIEHALEPI